MSDFCIDNGVCQLSAHNWDENGIGVSVAGTTSGHTMRLTRDQARALAVELIKLAGSDDPHWGPLIPWHGGECPLDEWEQENHRALVKPQNDLMQEWHGTHLDQWAAGSEFPVIAYRVRKRPPVEEWVRRTVVLGEQSAKVEILMRDGKAVDARMAQEGE